MSINISSRVAEDSVRQVRLAKQNTNANTYILWEAHVDEDPVDVIQFDITCEI